MKNIKVQECLTKFIVYQIIIIISTFKLKELIDYSNQKFNYLKLIFLISHLICIPFSFKGNKIFKILIVFFHLSAVIANNLEWSKEKFLSEIKPFDFKILLKFFFEIGLLLNIFIFLDSQENSDKNSTENENENENKTEEKKKEKYQENKQEQRRSKHEQKKNRIKKKKIY